MATIAELSVLIGANISGLQRGMQDANQSVDRFTRDTGGRFTSTKTAVDQVTGSLDRMSNRTGQIAGQLAGVFAPAGIGLGLMVNTASNFDDTLTELSVRTGTYGEDLERIRQKALQLGTDTAFSAQEALDAFLNLVTSGATVEEAYAQIGPVLDAAAASGEALGPTADIVTDIMAAFQLGSEGAVEGFEELQQQMGLTDDVFIAFGNDSEAANQQLNGMAERLNVSTSELYDMWNATKTLTPEIQTMADSLGISQQQWDEYAQFLNGTGGSVSAGIRTLIDETGVAGDRLYEMLNPGADAAMVVDALARAAGASSATMGDLGQGFANVGGQARAFGLDVNETAAILAIFSENGIKGAEGGTQLRSMLTNMSRDTTDVKAAWNSLGTSMYDSAGNMRPLEQILEDIRLGMDGKTEKEQNEILQDLAGSYGILGLRALLGGVSIEEMQAKMMESASASEVAEARTATFSGTLDQLKGTIETFMINAGIPFMENVLQPLVGNLTNAASAAADWAAANPEAMSSLLGLVAAGVIAVPVLWGISAVSGAINGAVRLAAGAYTLLSGRMGLLLIPIGLIVATDWDKVSQGSAKWAEGFEKIAKNETREGIRDVAEGVGLIVAAIPPGQIANDLLNTIERIAGFELPSVEEGFAAWGDAINEFSILAGTIIEDIQRRFYLFGLDMRIAAKQIQADLTAAVDSEAAAPMYLELHELRMSRAQFDIQDTLWQELGQQLNQGDNVIEISPELRMAIAQNPETLPETFTQETYRRIVAAAQRAIESGDGQFMLDVAPLLQHMDWQGTDFTDTVQPIRDFLLQSLQQAAWEAGVDPNAMTPLINALNQMGVPMDVISWDGDQIAYKLISDIAYAMQDGKITLDEPLMFDFDENGVAIPFTVADMLGTLDMGTLSESQVTAMQTWLEEAIAGAVAGGDMELVMQLNNIKTELFPETEEVVRNNARTQLFNVLNNIQVDDVNSTIRMAGPVVSNIQSVVDAVRTAIESTPVQATVNAFVQTNPILDALGQALGVLNFIVTGAEVEQPQPSGRHATGLDRVPYDGYLAYLHQDETVLTAQEAPVWRALKGGAFAPVASSGGSGGGQVVQHFHITAYGETPDALARMIKKKMQEQARGGGVFD